MMKKSAKLLGIALSVATVFSAIGMYGCDDKPVTPPEDDPPPPAHTHTYNMDKWESDESEHWHPATCEHTTLKSDVAEHDAEGTDGGCSVCKRPHTHTFEEEWTFDGTKHWHAATCIHFELVDGEQAHVIGDDGGCTVCDWAPHVHTYEETWSTSAYAHWHAANCTGDYEGDVNKYASASGRHTFDADGKCTVCDYQHMHGTVEYYAVDENGHWTVYDCEHFNESMTEKPDYQDHDTNGTNGACSVCGWLPVVTEPQKGEDGTTVVNGHVHGLTWQYSADNHWKRIKCDWMKNNGCKSCDKGYYAPAPKSYDFGAHTYDADGKCTECGFNRWSWGYNTDDCIECDECGGCIKTVCKHENEPDHKACGHARGTEAKRVVLEAEEAELWRVDGAKPSVLDYTGGKRDGIQVSNEVNAAWTITVNKETTVTLRLRCTRREKTFAESATVQVDGVKFTTKTPLAQPNGEDPKCNPAWLTFGCITLKAGENRLEILQVGAGFNLDKIELITDADITIDYTPVKNEWITELKQPVPIPRA